MHKSTIIESYSRLLADLAQQTKRPLIEAHWYVSEEWLLHEAPKLDKLMFAVLEAQANPNVSSIDIKSMAMDMGVSLNERVNLLVEKQGAWRRLRDGSLERCESEDWFNQESLFSHFHDWMDETLNLLIKGEDITSDIKAAHQMLVFCYKAEHEPSKEQLEAAYRAFEENDASIRTWNDYFDNSGSKAPLSRIARALIARVIYQAKWEEINPRHGPGAVTPAKNPSQKSDFKTYYQCIDDIYPYTSWMHGIPCLWDPTLPVWRDMVVEHDIVCKLTAVPKDSRGPRLICVHPAEAIWIQQGVRSVLEDAIRHSPLTSGKINFRDQTVNGALALKASYTREFTTLDLKDASDRLSEKAVRYLFGDYAYAYIGCSRASRVQIGSRVLELNKFAPMGNALTFPVQSLVYWAVVRAGILTAYGEHCNDVYVFGDDIIYPSKYDRGVRSALIRFGLVINANKTFTYGSFRESCGVEAWKGTDITPLRLKVYNPSTVSNAMALCTLAKAARIRGLHRVSAFFYAQVRRRWGRLALTNNPYSQGLCEYEELTWDRLLSYEPQLRFNRKLHRWEVPTRLVRSVIERLHTHDWYHVQDSLLRLRRLNSDPDELADPRLRHSDVRLYNEEEIVYREHGCAYSERGYEYPIPHRVRLACGWTEVVMN